MKNKIALAAVGALSIVHIITAGAQPTPQILDQNRIDRAGPRTPERNDPIEITPPGPSLSTRVPFAPFVLKSVRLQNSSASLRVVETAVKPFIGRTVDPETLIAIVNAVSAAYADSNIALYRIAAPDQDFANGELRLVVLEGFIDKADIHGNDGRDHSLIERYGARLTQERPLSRPTLQRFVSLMRDIPGLKPEIQLIQGATPLATTLSVDMKQKIYDVALGLNNSGSDALGRVQMQGDLTLYGLLREGEQTRITLAVPADIDRFQYYAFSEAQPLDANGTVGQISYGYLHTLPLGGGGGHAHSLQFAVSHPFIRSYDENLYGTVSMDGLNSTNAFVGQSSATERVRALRLAGTYSMTWVEDFLALSAIANIGIDGLGASVSNPGIASTNFRKFNVRAVFNHALSDIWFVRLRAAGQISTARLPNSELYALGGDDFGHAFAASSLVGDDAAAGYVEVAWHPKTFVMPATQGSEIYGFVDGGKVWYRARLAAPAQDWALASAGAGLRLAIMQHFTVQVEGSHAVSAPASLPGPPRWHLGFSIKALY